MQNSLERLSRAEQWLEKEQGQAALKVLLPLRKSSNPEVHEKLGQAYQYVGQFNQSFKAYLRAHDEYKKMGDRTSYHLVRLKLGDVSRQCEDFKSAIRWYTMAKPLSNDSMIGLALAFRGLGYYDQAMKFFGTCLNGFKREKDKTGVAYTYWAMGTTQRFMGQFKKAQKNLKESLSLYKKLKDGGGIAYAQCGLGGTLRMRGLAKESGALYKKGNTTFKKLGDQFGLAYSNCGQGNALRMQGKVKHGIPYMKKAITLYQKLDMKGPRAFVLWSLAQAQQSLGQKSLAKKNLKVAEKLFKAVEDRRGTVYVLLGQGKYKHALSLAKKLKLPFEALHARYFLEGESVCPEYKKLGVDYPRFMKYKSIP